MDTSPKARAVALTRIRHARRCLDTLEEILEQCDPEPAPAVIADALAHVARVCGELENKPAQQRNMELVDAVALAAAWKGPAGLSISGAGWGFDPTAFRTAVEAWRASEAPPRRGTGSGRIPAKWKRVAAALRTAGMSPPSPDTLRRQHEDWCRQRVRRPAQ